MDNHSNESTLQVQGFTPYSQVPRWVLRSGGKLSHGAVRLYGVIMSYTDSNNTVAFPGQTRLSEDMGCGTRSIYTYMKELESFGALIIQKRRNERWGQFKSNNYVLVFNDPSAVECERPSATDCGLSKPISYLDPDLSTSDQRSDDHVARALSVSAREQHVKDHGYRAYSPKNPGGLTGDQRWTLIKKLQIVGRRMKDGHKFHDESTQEAWEAFTGTLEEYSTTDNLLDELAYQIDCGKFTVNAEVADPYEAGIKLNKMINTAPLQ